MENMFQHSPPPSFIKWTSLNVLVTLLSFEFANYLTVYVYWRKSSAGTTERFYLICSFIMYIVSAMGIHSILMKVVESIEHNLQHYVEKILFITRERTEKLDSLMERSKIIEERLNDIRSMKEILETFIANGSGNQSVNRQSRQNRSLTVPPAAPLAHSSETRTPSALDMSPIELVTSQTENEQNDRSIFSKAFKVFQSHSTESPLQICRARNRRLEASVDDKEIAPTLESNENNRETVTESETDQEQETSKKRC